MKKIPVIHPLLFAISPILILYTQNVNHVPVSEIFLPAIAAILFAILLWSFLILVFKEKKKSGFIVSLFFILFFSFGHIYNSIRYLYIGDIKIGRAGYLLVAIGLLLISATIFAIKSRSNFNHITKFLNLSAAFLVLFPIIMSAYGIFTRKNFRIESEVTSSKLETPGNLPDIYYIVLDAYAGSDVLKEFYNYDNSKFLENLSQKGFYIANKSRANYCRTILSLASSMNMVYLDDLSKRVGEEGKDLFPLINMIRHNEVAKFLQTEGYKFVSFATGFSKTEIKNADIYISKPGLLSEFQNVLLNITPIPIMLKEIIDQHELHRDRLLFTFKSLSEIPHMKSPKFVLAHILAPHPPFVFGNNGEAIKSDRPFYFRRGNTRLNGSEKEEYMEKYKNQLSFINNKLQETIGTILSHSAEPPIIILQGDHGPGAMLDYDSLENTNLKERMSILNAFYLPQNGQKELYDNITPVNSFRVIFNHYFGTNLNLLNDKNYFSTWNRPFKFFDVTDKSDVIED